MNARAATAIAEDDQQARDALAAGQPRTDGELARAVRLGSITVPSGTLAVFDVGLMGYLPLDALEPLLVTAQVPRDRALAVMGTRLGTGRFADRWDHVVIELADAAPGDERPAIARARKLGDAAVDLARLSFMDRAALEHWRHEDSLDQLADVVFWGRDADALAKALGARRLANGEGHGWTDLPLAEAEAKADRAATLRAEHRWLLTCELRPHSHHFAAMAAARASPSGAGVIEVGGARALVFFTGWGEGVFPVYLDVDRDDQPVRIRLQLAPVA